MWQNCARRMTKPLGSPLSRLECFPELIGQRAEPLRRRRIRARSVLAHFVGLLGVEDRLPTEPDAPARRIDLEDDDFDVAADGKRLRDVALPREAGFTQRHEPG